MQKCVGCEVIADRQQELEKQGSSLNGLKVALVPVSVQAALQTERDMAKAQRVRRWGDE